MNRSLFTWISFHKANDMQNNIFILALEKCQRNKVSLTKRPTGKIVSFGVQLVTLKIEQEVFGIIAVIRDGIPN